jgi:tetratricopeptide (TPR) repeat protein
MTLAVIPFFVVVVVLAGCARPPALDQVFIDDTEQSLTPSTLNSVLLSQEALRDKPGDATRTLAVAYAYLQAQRESADPAYYDRIEKLLQRIESSDLGNPDIPFLRGSIAAGKHDFQTALRYARQVTDSHPEVARYQGLLTDALVETGQYEEAVEALQAMSDIRPDYAALTRIAYLREIHGDVPGAIEAMEQALEAQTGVPENGAWALCEYGRLVLPSDPDKAGRLYAAALEVSPHYAPALAGLAKVAMTKVDIAEGKKLAQAAFDVLPLPEYATLLGDIALVEGNAAKAATSFALVRAGYDQIAMGGTDVELERARFLVDHDLDLDTIVAKARAVYDKRPTIYAADTLAWALAKNEKYKEAGEAIVDALKTGSHDPFILFHAALIAKANGEGEKAQEYAKTVREESPYFSFRWMPVLEKELPLP